MPLTTSMSRLTSLPAELLLDITEYLSEQSLEAFANSSVRALQTALHLRERQNKKINLRSVLVWDTSLQLISLNISNSLDYYGMSLAELQKHKKLVDASHTGDVSTVSALLQDGVSPNPPGLAQEEWFRPLQAASHQNHRQVITLLLESGAELPRISPAENYIGVVLLLCIGNMECETLALLASHARAAGIEWPGVKLAHWTCDNGLSASQISLLISNGLWSDEFAAFMWTPIACLISGPLLGNGKPEGYKVLRLLLSDPQRRNNPCSLEGYFPIHQAVRRGYVETVRILLQEFGADPNFPTPNTRDTPLKLAIERMKNIGCANDVDIGFAIVKLFLASGASPKDDLGTFKYAVVHDSPAIMLLLDTWVARFGLHDNPEELLIAAAALGDVPMIQKLLPLCDTQPRLFGPDCRVPALDMAVRSNHYEAVRVLLPCISPELLRRAYSSAGTLTTPLHWAIYHSSEAVAKLLLSCYTPEEPFEYAGLIWAAIHNKPLSIVSIILDRVPGPITPCYINRILDAPATTGDYELLLLLLKHIESHEVISDPKEGTEFIHRDRLILPYYRANPLISAVRSGNLAIVQALVKHRPEYVTEKTVDGISPLLMAFWTGRVDILRALFAAGADPNSSSSSPPAMLPVGERKVSLIWEAAHKGHTHIMEQFLASGCDVNSRNPYRDDWTLLSWASQEGAVGLVRALLEHKANVHERDNLGRTALSVAAINGKANVVRILIQAGASVNAADNKGRTPLNLALKHGIDRSKQLLFHGLEPTPAQLERKIEDKVHAARVLLENGADMNMLCHRRGRRCHSLTEIKHLPLLQFYLDHGLTVVDEADRRGRTLVHYAVENGNHSMVRFLVSAGFDIFTADGEGKTPLHFAFDDEMVRILYWKR